MEAMAQDGQAAPADVAPTRLQVVLLAYDDDGERDAAKDQYAVIRFPNSYEVIPCIRRTHPLPVSNVTYCDRSAVVRTL
jgi:hypothetical protein